MTGRARRLIARYVPEAVRGRLGLGPDFLIIGTQRGGTTSLYDYLSEHPCIAGALKKEVEFFDLNYHRGIGWYRAHFPSVLEQLYARRVRRRPLLTGEASPSYLFHPLATRRMGQAVPEAKLILLLRNPVERAHSHYWHEVRHGREPLPFEEAIDAEPGRLEGELEKVLADERYDSVAYQRHSYLARGRYAEQLERLAERFATTQMLVLKSEAFYADPARTYREVIEFLGLPRWEPRRFRALNAGSYQPMDAGIRKRLAEYFRPHNQRLYERLGVDFGWR